MKTYGNREEVYTGLAKKTRGGLTKNDIILKGGKYISRRISEIMRNVRSNPLGVIGMMNRKDLTTDDYISRFHAIHKSGANMLNMFIAPIDDEWLKYLKRWKNHCKGCPN